MTPAEEEVSRPIRIVARVAAVIGAALLVLVALLLLGFVSGAVTSSFWRFVVAAVLAFAVASLGIGYFRQLANPPPPDPEPTEVHPSLRLAYVCEMCGMELAVLKVAKEKPPKHCGEAMVLTRRP